MQMAKRAVLQTVLCRFESCLVYAVSVLHSRVAGTSIAHVTQWLEYLLAKQDVAGSNPVMCSGDYHVSTRGV